MEIQSFEATKIETFIKGLGEEELVYLNRLVIARLQLIYQEKSTNAMKRFNPGEKVEFQDHEGKRKTGIITRLNKKTATIDTADGQHWNVAPSLLKNLDV